MALDLERMILMDAVLCSASNIAFECLFLTPPTEISYEIELGPNPARRDYS
jgi:hypothetical protein